MKNGDQTAFACCNEQDIMYGLTKREYFAGLAMQGLCAGRTEYENPMCDVKKAVELADLLLKELDKPISTTED